MGATTFAVCFFDFAKKVGIIILIISASLVVVLRDNAVVDTGAVEASIGSGDFEGIAE